MQCTYIQFRVHCKGQTTRFVDTAYTAFRVPIALYCIVFYGIPIAQWVKRKTNRIKDETQLKMQVSASSQKLKNNLEIAVEIRIGNQDVLLEVVCLGHDGLRL